MLRQLGLSRSKEGKSVTSPMGTVGEEGSPAQRRWELGRADGGGSNGESQTWVYLWTTPGSCPLPTPTT